MIRKGLPAVPVLATGLLIFPVLALFAPLAYVADARYSLPFLPQLLMGLGAWLLLLPDRVQRSSWLVACYPPCGRWSWPFPSCTTPSAGPTTEPDAAANSVVRELDDRGIRYLGGNYWGVYVVGYLADGAVTVKPDSFVRLTNDADRFAQADPAEIAYLYGTGESPNLSLPADSYERMTIGGFDLYFPPHAAG